MEIEKKEPNIIMKRKALVSYDYIEDIFYGYPLDREYEKSVMLGDFIIDLNKEDKIVGIEIMKFSKVLRMPKYYVQQIRKGKIAITASSDRIDIEIMAEILMRNKHRERLVDIREHNDGIVAPSTLVAPIFS